MSCFVLSYRVLSYHVLFYLIMSCFVLSWHVFVFVVWLRVWYGSISMRVHLLTVCVCDTQIIRLLSVDNFFCLKDILFTSESVCSVCSIQWVRYISCIPWYSGLCFTVIFSLCLFPPSLNFRFRTIPTTVWVPILNLIPLSDLFFCATEYQRYQLYYWWKCHSKYDNWS